MPRYYSDLKSVKKLAEKMTTKQIDEKKYKGIIPQTEKDLPQARKELSYYFRIVWKDELQALEVELGVTEETYGDVTRNLIHDAVSTLKVEQLGEE